MSRDQPLSNYQYFKVNQVHPLAPHADRSVRGYVLKTWLSSPVLDSGDTSRDNVDKAGFHGNINGVLKWLLLKFISNRVYLQNSTRMQKRKEYSVYFRYEQY